MNGRHPSIKAFSLTELLIVVSIFSILLLLLAPSLRKALSAAQDIRCNKNLSEIYMVVNSYAEEFDQYIPPHFFSKDGFRTLLDGGPYGNYGGFMTAIQGYEAGLSLNNWGAGGKMNDPKMLCPSYDHPGNIVGASDRRRVSYNTPYELYRSINGRYDLYGQDGSNYLLNLFEIHEPSLTPLLGDAPPASNTSSDNRNGWLAHPRTTFAVTPSFNSIICGYSWFPSIGIRASHQLASAFPMLYFDGHLETFQVPNLPKTLHPDWLKLH